MANLARPISIRLGGGQSVDAVFLSFLVRSRANAYKVYHGWELRMPLAVIYF